MTFSNTPLPAELVERFPILVIAGVASDTARAMCGEWAAVVISLAAIISSLGALNGWTLMLSQVPMAAARDGAMPSIFAHLSPRGVPARGLILSVSLATLLLLIEVSGSSALISFYTVIVELSTDAAMIPYVFCCVVEAILFITRHPLSRVLRIGPYTLPAIVAFVFSMGTIYGAGPKAGMWCLILVLLATPIWIFLRKPPSAPAGAPERLEEDVYC